MQFDEPNTPELTCQSPSINHYGILWRCAQRQGYDLAYLSSCKNSLAGMKEKITDHGSLIKWGTLLPLVSCEIVPILNGLRETFILARRQKTFVPGVCRVVTGHWILRAVGRFHKGSETRQEGSIVTLQQAALRGATVVVLPLRVAIVFVCGSGLDTESRMGLFRAETQKTIVTCDWQSSAWHVRGFKRD